MPQFREYTDDEIFGPKPREGELTDADVFGETPLPAKPSAAQPSSEGAYGETEVLDTQPRPSFVDRFKAHVGEGFFTGTLAGAGSLQDNKLPISSLSPTARILTDEEVAARSQDRMAAQGEEIIRQKKFEAMPDSESVGDYTAAVLGELVGGAASPENFVTGPVKLGQMLYRGARQVLPKFAARMGTRGAQVAAVNVATDPVVQTERMDAGVQDEYKPLQTALSAGVGFGIGAGGSGLAQAWKALRTHISAKNGIPEEEVTFEALRPEDVTNDPAILRILEANGVVDGNDPRIQQLQARLAAAPKDRVEQVARQPDAAPVPEQPVIPSAASLQASADVQAQRTAAQNVLKAEATGGKVKVGDQTRQLSAEDVAAQRAAIEGPKPPEQIAVDSRGNAGEPSQVQDAVSQRAQMDREAQRDFDLARKAPDYETFRAQKEQAFRQEQDTAEIAKAIGEDPVALVRTAFGMEPDQFNPLPAAAKVQLVEAASKKRGIETTQAPTLRVSDTSGEGRTSPESTPQPAAQATKARGEFEDTTAKQQPLPTEKLVDRTSAGSGDRPFRAEEGPPKNTQEIPPGSKWATTPSGEPRRFAQEKQAQNFAKNNLKDPGARVTAHPSGQGFAVEMGAPPSARPDANGIPPAGAGEPKRAEGPTAAASAPAPPDDGLGGIDDIIARLQKLAGRSPEPEPPAAKVDEPREFTFDDPELEAKYGPASRQKTPEPEPAKLVRTKEQVVDRMKRIKSREDNKRKWGLERARFNEEFRQRQIKRDQEFAEMRARTEERFRKAREESAARWEDMKKKREAESKEFERRWKTDPEFRRQKKAEADEFFAQQRKKYEQQAKQSYKPTGAESSKADDLDADGTYPVTEHGFVMSDKGTPIIFGDQKSAAKWILSEGNKKSNGQVFEVANHPSGKGFTAWERERISPGDSGSSSGREGVRGPGPRDEAEPRGPVVRGETRAESPPAREVGEAEPEVRAERREAGDGGGGEGRGAAEARTADAPVKKDDADYHGTPEHAKAKADAKAEVERLADKINNSDVINMADVKALSEAMKRTLC